MAYQLTLLNPKFRNWVKAGIALNVTREGFEDFVEKNNNAFHSNVIGKLSVGAVCISCSTENVVYYRSQNNLCKFTSGACLVHVATNRFKACGASVCNVIRDEVTRKHRYQPNWKNTNARKWCNNSWEIAKCYMADGYESKSTAADTDIAGLLSVVINNKVFQTAVTNSLTNKNNIFCQARETRNTILHNARKEVTDTELRHYINTMILLLSDPCYLASDPRAKNAISILNQIITDTLTITTEDEISVREASRKAIKEETQQAMRQINERSQNIMNEIRDVKGKLSKEIETEQEFHLKSIKTACKKSERAIANEKDKFAIEVRKKRSESSCTMKDENDKAVMAIRKERVLHKQEIKIETQKAVASIRNERKKARHEIVNNKSNIRRERQAAIAHEVIQSLKNEICDMRKEFKATQCVAKEGHYAIKVSKAAVYDIFNKYKADVQLGLKRLFTDGHGAFHMEQTDGYFLYELGDVPYLSEHVGLFGRALSWAPYKRLYTNIFNDIYTMSVIGNGKITIRHYRESTSVSSRQGITDRLIFEETLTRYDFIFFVQSQDDYSSENVEETIKRCVLADISDDILGASEILLTTILRREKCLLIFYGSDKHDLQAVRKAIARTDCDATHVSFVINCPRKQTL